MIDTTYILEYRYDSESDDDWREQDVFTDVREAHREFTAHIKEFNHIIARVRKVRYVLDESVIASFNPISSEEYSDE